MKKLYRIKHKETGLYWSGSGRYKTLTKKGRIFKKKPPVSQFGSTPIHRGTLTKLSDFTIEVSEFTEVVTSYEEIS